MNKAVIVVGMHRSGSSATMGMLRILGVDIGDDLGSSGDSNNPKGYLENQEFYQFERKILRQTGARWDYAVPEEQILRTFKFYEKEFKILLRKFNRSEYWGYKAIRGGLFPEYLSKIPNLYLIICWRSPEAVVKSLKRRNGFTTEKSLWLYSTYYFRIFRYLSNHQEIPVHIVNYDSLVDNPKKELKKIAKFLDIEITKDMLDESEKWIEKRYRHFKAGG